MLHAIWAQSTNGVIGDGSSMPWHLPEDLQHFKQTTLHQPIIMGRRTWLSLPFRPLPGRENIVLSSQTPGEWSQGATVTTTIPDTGWIIGGGQVYAATIDAVATIERTVIDQDFDLGERAVYAPEIPSTFCLTTHSPWLISASGLRYRFETWKRI